MSVKEQFCNVQKLNEVEEKSADSMITPDHVFSWNHIMVKV